MKRLYEKVSHTQAMELRRVTSVANRRLSGTVSMAPSQWRRRLSRGDRVPLARDALS